MDVVKNKFPSNCVFMYGKAELNDPKFKDILLLYAIKTLDNGQAELGGEGISASQDYDERGRVAIKMNMDKAGTAAWGKNDNPQRGQTGSCCTG
jgi:SecD/SecF fusion protein